QAHCFQPVPASDRVAHESRPRIECCRVWPADTANPCQVRYTISERRIERQHVGCHCLPFNALSRQISQANHEEHSMTLSRRNVLKLGLGAGAVTLLDSIAGGVADAEATTPGSKLLQPPRNQILAARPLPLDGVRLLGGPLKQAQDADIKYLLELEPDRMLAYYRQNAGLTPRAKPYGGWDGGGRNLTGHIAGHYLSATSAMWSATGDRRFKDRVDYIVAELKLVQDKHGDGYLSAL